MPGFSLRVLQNNKALKHAFRNLNSEQCLRVLQNNKALKPSLHTPSFFVSLRVLQNNKALKPQIRLKTACRRTVILF